MEITDLIDGQEEKLRRFDGIGHEIHGAYLKRSQSLLNLSSAQLSVENGKNELVCAGEAP